MLNYFLSQKDIPQVAEIINLLNSLKKNISCQDYNISSDEYQNILDLFDSIKDVAILAKDEPLANAQYVAKSYFKIFVNLSSYLSLIENQKYEKSWLKLQDCLDNAIHFCQYVPLNQRLEIDELIDLFHKYEDLYPYSAFLSSEYSYNHCECSICGKSISDLECTHIMGDLYWGECAYGIIHDISEMPAIAIVSHPKDKRCVINISDDQRSEGERFKKLGYFFSQLKNPLQNMELEELMQKKRNHDIKKQERNELCLCGSGKKFKKCCINNMYYDNLHFRINIKREIRLIYF